MKITVKKHCFTCRASKKPLRTTKTCYTCFMVMDADGNRLKPNFIPKWERKKKIVEVAV